ncbi:MAG TPA: hypothetical protein DEX20_10865 [Halieaceae bacterium]|nr:hypothetical protein [Halieaceae bacterium]
MSAILSGAYSASQTGAGLLYQVDPTYVDLDLSSGAPVFTVPGQASFLSLDPFAVMASITGVTIADITANPALAAVWTGTGAQVPGLLSGAMGVDGGTQLLATNRMSYWQQDTQSSAAFIQGTYRIDDAWSITAGIRYTEETKDVYAMTELGQSATGLGNAQSPAEAPLLHGVLAASFATWAHEFEEDRATNQVVPGVTLQWEPDDNTNLYVAYAEGFKSGGFNSVDDQNPDFVRTEAGLLDTSQPIRNVPGPGFEYDDENASSWEIGGKHRLMDGRMQLNWAAFNSTYENLQVSTFAGLGFIVANAAEATIKGFEFDVNFQATENLRLALAMGFNDGSYDSFPGAGCSAIQQNALVGAAAAAGGVENIVGQDLLGCTQVSVTQQSQNLGGAKIGTDYNGTAQIEYVQPLSSDMMWFTQVDYNFTDGYFLQGDREPAQYQDAYGQVNFRTGLRTDNWFLQAYGRNVLDEQFASGGFNVPLAQGSFARYQAPGAVFGFQAAYQF